MDLNDWLYILFIGIAVVSSLFSGAKKKRKQNSVPSNKPQQQVRPQVPTAQTRKPEQQQKPASPSWMDILQQLEEKAKQPQQKPQPAAQPKPVLVKPQIKSQPTISSKSTLTDKKPRKQQLESRISRKIENQGPIELEAKISGINLNFGDISEIKKGIIYSEIFNRKY
jgi:hypothetical protein